MRSMPKLLSASAPRMPISGADGLARPVMRTRRSWPKTKGPADNRTVASLLEPPQACIPDAAEALTSPRRRARAASTIVRLDPVSTMNGYGPWPFRQTPAKICETAGDGVRMRSGMTTVCPEDRGAAVDGQLPVKPGTRSFDVNGANGASEACAGARAAGAREAAAPGPGREAASSSGTRLTASHGRHRGAVRGQDDMPHLQRAHGRSGSEATGFSVYSRRRQMVPMR